MSIQVTPPIGVEIKNASVMPFEEYEGEYDIQPGASTTVLETASRVLRQNVVIGPDGVDPLICGTITGEVYTEAASIRPYMFSGCAYLESVIAPNCNSLGASGVFTGCNSLKKVLLGKITTLNQTTDINTPALEEISFPEVTSIVYTVYQRPSLKRIHLPKLETVTGNNVFMNASGVTNVVLPSVYRIYDGFFRYATGVKVVDFGSDVTETPSAAYGIGGVCFQGSTSLETIIMRYPFLMPLTGNSTFCDAAGRPLSNIQNIYVPEELVDTYKAANKWSAFASKISAIPEGV